MQELLTRDQKITPEDIQAMLFNHRNYGAELLLDDVLDICRGQASLVRVCNVLAQWDRTGTVDSRGSHVWREFWNKARAIDDLYANPFDLNNPVNTPNGISRRPEVVNAIRAALTHAQEVLHEANIALDAPLGEIQFAPRNGENIPVPGGEGWAGMFSMIVSKLAKDVGYSPIVHGNSYVQVVSWDAMGQLDPRAILTYSQSPESDSPFYSDQTKLYAQGEWIRLPFTDAEIAADPNLRTLELLE